MDYDDNEFQGQNLQLAGEGCSKVSPVLHPYALPKFDFDDSLQGHLRFDSLVDNEVFFGITNQEDNQWIEEYSRGSSGIEFSSSAVESRRNNVWSEATSSESVEMLLKSVGQEEKVVGETIIEQLDICDEPGSLTKIMDPNLNQDDGKDHVTHVQNSSVPNEFLGNFPGFSVNSGYEQPHVRFTSQSQEVQISGGELDSVVINEKCNSSVLEENVDSTFDDVFQKKAENLANESMDKELPEDSSVSRVENPGSSENACTSIEELKVQENLQQVSVNASVLSKNFSSGAAEHSIKSKENSMDVPMNSGTMIVESCTYSMEKSLCVVPNVESVDNLSAETSIPFNEEPTSLLPTRSSNMQIDQGCDAPICSAEPSQASKCAVTGSLICSEVDQDLKDNMHEESLAASANDGKFELQAVQDGNTKDPNFLESNADLLSRISPVKNSSVDENEYAIGKDAQQITSDTSVVSAGNLLETCGGSSIDQVGTRLTEACLPGEVLAKEVSNEDVIAGNNASEVHTGDSDDEDRSMPAKSSGSMQVDCKIRSSKPVAICVDQDVSFNDREDASLPLESSDMDIEVVQALDSQKNVEPSLSAEDSKENTVRDHNFESDVSVRVEPVAATESDKSSSPYTSDGSHIFSGSLAEAETDDQPKSPILGVSLVHQDHNEKTEVGFPCEGNSQNEIPQVESVAASASKNPSSLVEKEASPDLAERVVNVIDAHCATSGESCNASQIEQEPEANTGGQECFKMLEMSPFESSEKKGNNSEAGSLQGPKESMIEVNKSNEHQTFVDVARPSECDANHIAQDGGSFSSLDKPQFVSPTHVSSMELSQSAKDKQEATKDVTHDSALPSKIADDVQDIVRTVSPSKTKQEEKKFTFEINKSAGLGQASKDFQSYPTFQVSILPKIMEVTSTDSSSCQVDAKKLQEVSLGSQSSSGMTSQIGVKGKSERKSRRKSVGKENARNGNPLQEATLARDSVRVEKSSVSSTLPANGQVIQFEEVKSNENVERGATKPGTVLPLPKLPDLNNSTSIFQQPFTDNQQVQLRAQILVYGSLISGTPPEEPHMIAAFGQSDGGRTWEGVWRACLERLHVQKAQANSDSHMQSRSDLRDAGNRADQGIKHASVQNKIPSSPSGGASTKGTPPIVSPMILLSSPLWNISTPSCDGLQSSGMPRTGRLDYHQALSPLHPYQTPAVQNFSGHNPSWLSQGPFAGQWVAASPIPAFNTGPRFPALPITEAVKLTPVKESGSPGIKHTSTPVVHNSAPSIFPEASALSGMEKATASSDQPFSDPKSRKRKKGNTSANVKRISEPSLAQIASVSAPVVIHFPQDPRTEDQGNISLLAQNQTDSVIAPVVSSPYSTSVAVSTPAFVTSKSSPAKFLPAVSPTPSHHPISGDQNVEKVVTSEETLSKVEESKLQAEDAAEHAAAAVSHCHGVWSQLERQNNSGLNSVDEAKLVSSAVSIAAAASVAKVAAVAAKIASNVAEQARSMVNVFLSNGSEIFDQSSMISLVNKFDKTTDAILRGRDRSSHPNSIIYTARQAAWRRHAENLDAIVKAAELAAEAVSQAGKIVAMSEPLPLRDLVEAGPEGYWKTPRLASKQQALMAENLNGTDKKNVEAASEVSAKGLLTTKCGLSGEENSGDLAEKQKMEVDGISVPFTSHEKDKRKPRVRKSPDLSKTIGVAPELEIGSIDTSVVGQTEPKVTSGTLKENNIKEGCLVEVYKDDDKYNGAWFGANVLSLKDGKALVCYTEIQSNEGSGQLKEWVPLEDEGTEVPKIRVAHPVTTMRLEGTRKRRRTAATDFVWSSGDRVDVWIKDCWREAVVMETNKTDVTSLTVQFPAQGEVSVVRSWLVRPTLIWKDGKWIEYNTSDGRFSSQGDTPQEKRLKLGSPVVESKKNDGSSENVDLVDSRKQEESRTPSLSTHESLFSVGSTRDDKKLGTHRTMRSGLQKEGPRVIFGIPKPGKKQKFMDVSKHYVADGINKNNRTHDSVKFTRYLIPQAPGSHGWKNNSRSDSKEKQPAETKPRMLKSRKPPIPSGRMLTSAKSTTRDTSTINKTVLASVSEDENQSVHQNQMEFESVSNIEDAPGRADLVSSLALPTEPPKRVSTSSTKSERLNKRKFAPAGGKTFVVEKSLPELVEPRRSNRKIQPTSRMLEGLQSSMTISKIPATSHSTQRSHSKVTPKGNTNNG